MKRARHWTGEKDISSGKKLAIIACAIFLGGALFAYSAMGGTLANLTLFSQDATENGLVLHWTMDGKDFDASQGSAEVWDASGNGNDGDGVFPSSGSAASPVVIFLTTPGTGDWTVPDDWNDDDNSVEVIGGGGGGSSNLTGGGGGGGGAYSKSVNLDLTPGGSAHYRVGQAGAVGGDGTTAWFNAADYASCVSATVCVSAENGQGDGTGKTGAPGGGTGGVGTVKFAGGAGGTGNSGSADSSGGGGGAGSPNGTGGTGGDGDTVLTGDDGSGGGGGAGCDAIGTANDGVSGTAANDNGGNGGDSCYASGGLGGISNDSGQPGSDGSGGGGADEHPSGLADGGTGGAGASDWTQTSDSATAGAGGGGGGGEDVNPAVGGDGGNYGGGGGGGATGGAGAQGIIVITYTPTGGGGGASEEESTTTPGRIGQALNFDGTDDYVDGGDIDGGAKMKTFAFWMKAATTTASQSLINVVQNSIRIETDSSSVVTATGFTSPTIYVDGSSASASIPDLGWHHVVVVTNSTGVDANNFAVASTTNSKPFGGAIDDVRVYNRQLSQDDITRLYHLGGTTKQNITIDTQPATKDGLVAHWTLDGKDMNTGASSGQITDLSGNGYDGTLGGMGSGTSTVAGRIGQALNFDGVDDYVGGSGGGGASTVAFDAVGPSSAGAGGTSQSSPLTWSHTISGSNTALFVSVNMGGTLRNVTGVTYNGVALTKIDERNSNDGTSGSTELWYLVNPASGTHTVSVAWSGGTATAVEAGSVSFTGVDQSTPYQNETSAAGASATASVTVTSSAGNMAVDSIVGACQISSPTQTIRWLKNIDCNSGGNNGAQSTAAGASSVTFQYSIFNADSWAIIGADVKAAPAVAAGLDIGNVKTVAFWAKPDSTTESVIDLDGTKNIKFASGVVQANNVTSPTIYVDGVQTTTFPDTNWHHVVVTTNTAVDASALFVGKVGSSYYGGSLDDVRMYDRVLSQDDITRLYHLGGTAKMNTTLKQPQTDGDLVGHWTFDGKDTGSTAAGAWYSDYAYRRPLTIHNSQVATTSASYPYLATTTLADLKTAANGGKVESSGDDIVFTDSDGTTLLPFEQESYSASTGAIVYWINSSISSTTDKTIYMYYGKASDTNHENPTAVWPSYYKGVWHMAEDPSTTCSGTSEICDSTSNGRNADSFGTMTSGDQIAGQVDGSIDFDGTDDYVERAAHSEVSKNTSWSISSWVKADVIPTFVSPGDQDTIWENEVSSSDIVGLQVADGEFITGAYNGSSYFTTKGAAISTSVWYHAVVTYDGSAIHLWVNGVESGSASAHDPSLSIASDFTVGCRTHPTSNCTAFNGQIDEVQVASYALTAADIITQYNMSADNASFMTFGSEDTPGTVAVLDRSGQGNTGTVTGASAVPGRIGQGLSFNGTTDYVDAGNNSSLLPANDMTVAGWVWLDELPSARGEDAEIAYFRHSSSPFFAYKLQIQDSASTNDRPEFQWSNTSGTSFNANASISLQTGQWYHLAGVRDGSSLRIYLDGEDVTGGTVTPTGTLYSPDGDLTFGATSAVGSRLHGRIDDVRVYNRALSADDVMQLYRLGAN